MINRTFCSDNITPRRKDQIEHINTKALPMVQNVLPPQSPMSRQVLSLMFQKNDYNEHDESKSAAEE